MTPRVSSGRSFSGVGTAAWPVHAKVATRAKRWKGLFMLKGFTFFRRMRSADIGPLVGAAGRFKIAIRIAGVVVVVGKSVAMTEEVFHRFDGNGEAEPFAEGDFHVGDTYHFTPQIEQRSAAVAGIDLGGGLQ